MVSVAVEASVSAVATSDAVPMMVVPL